MQFTCHDLAQCRDLPPGVTSLIKNLVWIGAPPIVAAVALLVVARTHLAGSDAQTLDAVEFFAGARAFSNAVAEAGRAVVAYDIVYDADRMDILSDVGFANAVRLVLSLHSGSQSLSAPVCSSWTFINRGTSCRSSAFPLGNTAEPSVQAANRMVYRQVILLWLFTAKGVFWVLEQPAGSLLERHDAFVHLCTYINIWKTSIHMDEFGGDTSKPTWLYSAHASVLARLYNCRHFKTRKREHGSVVSLQRSYKHEYVHRVDTALCPLRQNEIILCSVGKPCKILLQRRSIIITK